MTVFEIALIMTVTLGFILFWSALLAAFVWFVLTLYQMVALCAGRNRTIEPIAVWLVFVPFFNFFWWFYLIVHLRRTLKNEFTDRGTDDGSDYGRKLGIWCGVVAVIGYVAAVGVQLNMTLSRLLQGDLMMQNPFDLNSPGMVALMVQSPFLIVSLALWLAYWKKIARCKKRLETEPAPHRPEEHPRRDVYDDRDHDQPRRRSRPDERIR
jgi:hypothetical protein